MKNKLGRFDLDYDIVRNNPESLLGIFAKCVIIRAEPIPEYNRYEYTALSNEFEELAQHSVIPSYDWICEEDKCSAKPK